MADKPAWATEATPAWATGAAAPAPEPAPAAPSWAAPSGATPEPTTQYDAPRVVYQLREKPSTLHRLAGAGAAIADIPLSMPAMFVQTVDEWGHAAYETLRDLPEHALTPERAEKLRAEGKKREFSVQDKAALEQEMTRTGKERFGEARQHAAELLPEWVKTPAQSLFSLVGGSQEVYQASAPSKVMKHVGSWMEHGANYLEKETGTPSEFFLMSGDAAMMTVGGKLPGYIKARFAKPDAYAVQQRLLTQRPTGSKGPAIVTPEQAKAVVAEMDKERAAPTKPVDSPEMLKAKRRRTHLAEGEYISSPHEGDLTDWEVAHKAHIERVKTIKNQPAPEYVPPGGELPPIEAYEGSMQPPRQIADQIRHITSDPDINSPDVTVSQLAQDLAAEQTADVLRPNEAIRPEKIGDRQYRFVDESKPAGDEWLNTSKQGGKVSPRLVVPFGIVASGAVVGAAIDPDSPIAAAFEGAAGGFALANLGRAAIDYGVGTKMGQVWSAVKPSVDTVRAEVAKITFVRTANIKAESVKVAGLQRALNKAIPKERLEQITHLDEQGRLDELTDGERYYVQKVKDWYAKIGTMAQEAGVIQRLIAKNFVPHFWDLDHGPTRKFFEEGGFDAANANAFTPHGLKRGVESYAAGMGIGLKPKTLNYSEILGMYANSVIRAVHNAEAIETLKTTTLGDGTHPVEMTGVAPKGYIRNHGIEGLEGYSVHPEAVKTLQRAFDSYDPGVIERALLSTAFTFKRVAVSYSLFHPAALTLAYLGAGGNVLDFALGATARGVEKATGGRVSIPYQSAVDAALKGYYEAGAGEIADWGIRNGLELGTPIEDLVGKKFFDHMTNAMDTALGGDIHGIKPFQKLDSSIHSFIWNYTQTGMKLAIFQKEFSRAIVKPENLGKDMNEIAADVASYTNNLFGTLNWERIIERQKSQVGRAVAGAAFSKKGLSIAQIVSFAPDWLVSTIRTWTQAVPGLAETSEVGRLNRQYIARSMLYSMAVADAVNMYYSGHHVWQNDFRSQRQKDKEGEESLPERIHSMTFIDLGDGTRMQYNKHLFEFVHAVTDPGNFLANKTSAVITDPINILSNRQWASFGFAPPISTSKDPVQRAADIAKWEAEHHLPIAAQQALKGQFGGMFGLPITGMTAEQRAALREQERAKK